MSSQFATFLCSSGIYAVGQTSWCNDSAQGEEVGWRWRMGSRGWCGSHGTRPTAIAAAVAQTPMSPQSRLIHGCHTFSRDCIEGRSTLWQGKGGIFKAVPAWGFQSEPVTGWLECSSLGAFRLRGAELGFYRLVPSLLANEHTEMNRIILSPVSCTTRKTGTNPQWMT